MTLNQQITLLKKFAENHRQINTVRHEPEYNIHAEKQRDGYVFWFFAEGSNVANTALRTTFVITVMDVLNHDRSNLDDILSDSLQILLDCEAFLLYYADENDAAGNPYNFDIERAGNFEPGIEQFNDAYAGHTVRITFVQGYNYDYCAIPTIPAVEAENAILLESGDYILLETGDFILQE